MVAANKSRVLAGVPAILFGLFLILIFINTPNIKYLNLLIFGGVYCYSGFLFIAPLLSKRTIPCALTKTKSYLISISSCALLVILPILYFNKFVSWQPFNKFIFSSYENGYILSVLVLLIALGFNVKLEQNIDKKSFFLPVLITSLVFVAFVIFIVIGVLAGLAVV